MEERIPWNKGLRGVQVAWSKGLTKETDKRLAILGERISIAKRIPDSVFFSKKKEMEELYINQYLPYDILLKKIGLSQSGFYYWRTKLGIPARNRVPPFSKKELYELYINQKLSMKQIEQETKIPHTTVGIWLRRYEISVRPKHFFRVPCSEETRKKIRLANKGKVPWNKNLKMPIEFGEEISKRKLQFKCNKQTLQNLYWIQQLTLTEIAKKYNMNSQTVLNRMNRLGIPRRSHSEALIGENHWNWKGGGIAVHGRWWTKIRQKILERDNFTCQLCFRFVKNRSNLIVHHLLSYRLYKNSDVDKLITLCKSCHSRIENSKRKGVDIFANPLDTSTD